MRIGFFGGSFDPPHGAHLAVARRAADAFSLPEVLLAPVGSQPLKPAGPVAPFRDRLAMVELLCAADPRLAPSDLDAAHADGTPNYTVDTLARLRADLPRDAQVFSIIGADAFASFHRWRSPDELLRLAEWIVVARPGTALEPMLQRLNLSQAQTARVHTVADLEEPASATAIRARLAAGDRCAEWLPPEVLDYIQQHHLYGT